VGELTLDLREDQRGGLLQGICDILQPRKGVVGDLGHLVQGDERGLSRQVRAPEGSFPQQNPLCEIPSLSKTP